MCHLLSIGEREDVRLSARIDDRLSIVGREAAWHGMNGGFFGRGAAPSMPASVAQQFERGSNSSMAPKARRPAHRSPTWSSISSPSVPIESPIPVPIGLVGELALFTRQATSQAFIPDSS
jgi:hypothetical protein